MRKKNLVIIFVSVLSILTMSVSCEKKKRIGHGEIEVQDAGRVEKNTKDKNPLGLLNAFGNLKKSTLNIGDITTAQKDTTKRSTATYAHLWLSLEDRERNKWINHPGWGEGNKFDNYVKSLIKAGRILPIAQGTRVKVVDIRPHPSKEYYLTYFKVSILEGKYSGLIGWLSSAGVKSSDE